MYILVTATALTMLYQLSTLLWNKRRPRVIDYTTSELQRLPPTIMINQEEYPIERRLFVRAVSYKYGKEHVKKWVREQFRLYRWNLWYNKMMVSVWYKKMFCQHIVMPALRLAEIITKKPSLPTMKTLGYARYMKNVLGSRTYQKLQSLIRQDIWPLLCPGHNTNSNPRLCMIRQGQLQTAIDACVPWQVCIKGKLRFHIK